MKQIMSMNRGVGAYLVLYKFKFLKTLIIYILLRLESIYKFMLHYFMMIKNNVL